MWVNRERHIFMPVMLGMIGAAWLSLVLWGQSPYARYLHHDALDEVASNRDGVLLVVFVGGWTLMTIAMMLPTSLPLIALFQRMIERRPDSAQLTGLLIAGYLLVWVLFGFFAHLADLGVHQLVHQLVLIERNEWSVGAGMLLLAGVYQFTPLKYHCLDKCRTPLSFIASRWSGHSSQRAAFQIGVDHGIFCVGCCWTLMLLMFLVGVGSIFWMLLLGTVMAIEKNISWGRQMSTPLGVALISAGCVVSLLAMT
ncbi:DUF2182 domain-containing protein [soil metagenome]